MDNKTFYPDNIPADLEKSWHIPRPTLARSSQSSQGSASSTNSTQSAKSGSLLLTAVNLAQIQENDANNEASSTRHQNIQYYLQHQYSKADSLPFHAQIKTPDPDAVSIASSTHFTVVNMHTRPPKTRSYCRKHQLTILVVTMSTLFTIGIIAAIFFLEMRANSQKNL